MGLHSSFDSSADLECIGTRSFDLIGGGGQDCDPGRFLPAVQVLCQPVNPTEHCDLGQPRLAPKQAVFRPPGNRRARSCSGERFRHLSCGPT